MRSVLTTLAILAAITVGYVALADDAAAFGHGRAAGCGAAAAGCSGGYSGWYPGRFLFGFERRAARRERRAARHAAYGCAGESYGCSGAPAGCSEPAGCDGSEVAPPPPEVEAPVDTVGHYETRVICNGGVCRTVTVFVPG